METLKSEFRKNGIDYRLLDRTAVAALFELRCEGEVCGYEVAKIIIQPAQTLYGKDYPEKEVLPSDELFGKEGSKAMFPHDKARAEKYLKELTSDLVGKAELKNA